jgi:hypothetical protein
MVVSQRMRAKQSLPLGKLFAKRYQAAISSFIHEEQGLASPELLHQCEAYGDLLKTVLRER